MAVIRRGPHGLALPGFDILPVVTVPAAFPDNCNLGRISPITGLLATTGKNTGLLERLNPIAGEFDA